MSTELPKPVPRKPRVRTQSHPDPQLSNPQGELEQNFNQLNLGDEKERLGEQVAELRREEQRLREVILQLQRQQSTLQEGSSQATLNQKETELMDRESMIRDKEFSIKNRELELRRLEEQLIAQKKEIALAKFDEDSEGMGMSSAQLAKMADKEIALQRQEGRLQQKEMELNEWALRLDQQAKENQQRLIEIQQREANVHVASTYPVVGVGSTQPHPQWGGETTRPQAYQSTNTTYYHQGQGQPPPGEGYSQPTQQWYPSDNSTPTRPTGYSPYTANTSTVLETHPTAGSPGYQHYQQQYSQQQEPSNQQYHSPPFYQQQQSPSGGAGMAHSSQTQLPGTPDIGSSSQLVESGVVFSVGGEGGAERNNLGTTSSSVASAMSAGNCRSGAGAGAGAVGTSRSQTLDQSEECARALQWEERNKTKYQEDADMELARKLQEQFDKEAQSVQQHVQSADQLLALQLQHEDLKEGYGSGLTHNNQLTGEGDGSEVTEVVKKVLDERMTRQHQIKEQEEADRRIAENISASDLGDPALQANVQNNLSS